ncbi:hypothetical protein HHI36_000863 [Cryptolaemus montrouzieri]|uniref:Apple domain-containing protein n=1 Tax=Cryptolaemus montrouzieri TaxID=559131 RepID=A0ABD2P6E1_9CUCU
MRNYPYVPSMVQAITVLTVLKMMTKAQTSCGSGSMNGKIMYERLPNIQLQGFDEDIVRDTMAPFMVLEKCQDLCLKDRNSQNIVRACASFDFQPGSRIATYNGGPEYEESTCYLSSNQARPEGMGSLMIVPNSVHFNEICLTSNRPDRECPNRRYIFERHPRKRLKLPMPDMKEVQASNRSDCEDKCLDEFSFVCRSATFSAEQGMCTLSRFTRRTHPELLQDDPDAEYLENTCLSAERRCDGLGVFIKEENRRLGGPFEVDSYTNITLEDCQGMCVRAEKYFCRSIEYDEMTKQCTISEEDSVSQKDDIALASSPTHHFYDFACLDSPSSQQNRHQRNLKFGGDSEGRPGGEGDAGTYRPGEYPQRPGGEYPRPGGNYPRPGGDYPRPGGDYPRPGGDYPRPGGDYPRPGGDYPRPGDYPLRPGGDYPIRPGGDYPIRPGGDYPIRPGDYPRPGYIPHDGYPPRPRPPPSYRPSSSGGDYDDRDRYYPKPPYSRIPPDDYPIRPLGPPRDGYPDRYPDSRYPDKYPGRYPPSRDKHPYYPPSSSGGGKYPYYPPSSSGGGKYPRPSSGDRYGDRDRYGGGDRGGYGSRYGERYPDLEYPAGGNYRPSSSGSDKYGGGSSYDNRYGGHRYPDRYPDRYGDRYGDKYGDRYCRYHYVVNKRI